MISSKIFGSNAINNIPTKDEKIKNHFLLLIFSWRNKELIKNWWIQQAHSEKEIEKIQERRQ